MSIVDEQILGGGLSYSTDAETAKLQRDPFGKNATQGDAANLHFKGFNYAPDTEAAALFGLITEYVGPQTDEDLWTKGTTTYGNPGQFTKISGTDSTILTQMGGFVQNGDGDEAEWGNQAMKRDFSQGSGTKSQTNRGEYDLNDGWLVPANGFNEGNKYEIANVNVDTSNEEETPEITDPQSQRPDGNEGNTGDDGRGSGTTFGGN